MSERIDAIILAMFRVGMDTFDIANRFNSTEPVILASISRAREAERMGRAA